MTESIREAHGSARLSCVNLAAAAAFTAAALSLVSVVISVVLTYRLSSRAHLEEWRRDKERPIVARLLTLSDDAVTEWQAGFEARRKWESLPRLLTDPSGELSPARRALLEHWDAGSELHKKIAFEAAQLNLIAGHPLRDVATKLVKAHWGVMAGAAPLSGRNDWREAIAGGVTKISDLQGDLVMRARADLGIDRGSESRLRSARRRFQARRKLARLKAAYPAFMIEPNEGPYRFVAVDRATGRRIALARTIESMEGLLADRQLARERGESPGLVQEL